MKKYESKIIVLEDVKVDTNSIYEGGIRYFTVRLTHIPTGIQKAATSYCQINAYNLALLDLEVQYESLL